MRISLEQYLDISPSKITDHKLDRLIRVLSFFKTESLQPSDFERLMSSQNPYVNATSGTVKQNFKQSMGGAFTTTDVHDWKIQATQ